MIRHYADKCAVETLCEWAALNRSVYYYKRSDKKRGIRPSTHTLKQDGVQITNEEVVEEIKRILSDEFITYGYDMMTAELKGLEYCINKK